MTHHLLKLFTGGLTTVAGINGAPVLIDPNGIGLSGSMPINAWLKPRENTLTIFLAKPLTPPDLKLPASEMQAEVFSVKPNSPLGEPDVVMARYERGVSDPVPLPVNREIAFAVTSPPPTKLWNEAARLNELTSADQQQLRVLVQRFAEALQRRNVDALLDMLDYKTKDCALANGHDPEEMRQVIRRLYTQGMFTEPAYQVEGAQANALGFKAVGGGQVVWLFQNLSTPALVVRSQSARYTLPLFAAKIDSAWRIVR